MNWKRVKVARWTPQRDVRVRHVKRMGWDRFEDIGHQLVDTPIGVAIPLRFRDGIVVMPLEFYSGRQWMKHDCRKSYMVVPEKWLEVLGPAHEDEIRLARSGIKAHKLEVDTPEELLWERLKEQYQDSDEAMEENIRARRRREKILKNLRNAHRAKGLR